MEHYKLSTAQFHCDTNVEKFDQFFNAEPIVVTFSDDEPGNRERNAADETVAEINESCS